MECYYQSMPSRNGYRKRMLQIWVDKGMFQVTEQRLVDQVNQIRKKQWLSESEFEEIRRLIDEGEYTGEMGGNEEDQETDRSEEEEVRTDPQLDEQNAQSGKLKIVEGCELSPEEVEVIKKLEEILQEEEKRLPSLRRIDRRKLKEVTRKVDAVLKKIETNDITTTNDLIYARAVVVTDLVGLKRGNRQTGKEPWWKRRLENQVKMLNKHQGRINALIQQKTSQEGQQQENEVPDQGEARRFWSDIWSKEGNIMKMQND